MEVRRRQVDPMTAPDVLVPPSTMPGPATWRSVHEGADVHFTYSAEIDLSCPA